MTLFDGGGAQRRPRLRLVTPVARSLIPLIPLLACGFAGAADAAPVDSTIAVAPAAMADPYRAEEIAALQDQAIAQGLAEDPRWLSLLHYAHGVRGHRSRVDDPRFFLDPAGKTDPAAELRATIAALCGPVPTEGPSVTDRFPARLEFLVEAIGLDRDRLAVPRCADIEAAWDTIVDRSVTLIFPDAYLGTPASMFGHTLLVLGGSQKSPLLRQSINYGAVATDSNGVVYAFRGVFGLYRGIFSLEPFHHKVQKYIDLDQRDLWEYDLDLSEVEVRRLVLHIWELREIWSDYYFFDENCSSNLLFLIDVARPGLGLAQDTGIWVIPIDTIRAIIDADLVKARRWRPSRVSIIRHLESILSGEDSTAVRDVAQGRRTLDQVLTGIDDPLRRTRILDTCIEYLRGERGRGRIAQDPYQKRLHAALLARARLGQVDDPAREPPLPAAPEDGHETLRASLGGGATTAAAFAELRLRPAIHDLLDAPGGFLRGSQVQFADTVLRWYDDTRRVEIEAVDVLSLRSFAPRDRLVRPLGWKFDLGYLQQPMGEDGKRRPHARMETGLGGAWQIGPALAHATVDVDLRAGNLQPHYAIGVGASLGAYIDVEGIGLLHPYAQALEYIAGDDTTRWEAGAEFRLWPAREWALTMQAARRYAWDWYDSVGSLRVDVYF